MKAALYARVSTDEQVSRAGIPVQLDACRRYVQSQGWELVIEIRDEGVSGAIPFAERPGGAEIIRLAREHEIDYVITYSVDRLSRDTDDVQSYNRLHTLLMPASEKPARRSNTKSAADLAWDSTGETYIRFATQSFDGTPAGELMFSIFMAVAKYERKIIRQRTMGGRLTRVREGKYQAPITPFGFTYSKKSGQLEINEETAPAVREMFDLAKTGIGTKEIAKRLDERGFKPPMVSHVKRKGQYPVWNFSSVYKMLRSRRYIGEASYGGERMTCPAIISDADFEAVQEGLSRRKADSPRGTKGQYLLQHFLYCGACGSRYTPRTDSKGRSSYSCYHRTVFAVQAKDSHRGRWRFSGDVLEGTVVEWVQRILDDPETVIEAFKVDVDSEADDLVRVRLDAAQKRLDDLSARRVRILDLAEQGLLQGTELSQRLDALQTEREKDEQVVTEERRKLAESSNVKEAASDWIRWLRGHVGEGQHVDWGADDFASADFDLKRRLVRYLLDKVTVESDGEDARLQFEGRIGSGVSLLTQSR